MPQGADSIKLQSQLKLNPLSFKAMLAPFSPLLRGLFNISASVQAADVTIISLAGVNKLFCTFLVLTFSSQR